MTNIPNELFYTKTHEWVKKISQSVVIMGITAHAQEQLRDIVFVELPSLGKELKAGEACAVVESVKAAYDIFSPLSGKVIKINEKIQEKPQRVNEDPYGEGWFLHIEISDPNEFNALLSQAQYQAICEPAP
ncbi:glycine cleavage system protein H [Candidatus Brocadia sapporoensis]|uniref:Glycine cleavage system H protein n=1 Tax=Candidatus Brocadia sapporoensis TaxID=392547 RepID=A0A1V6M0G7_9BACT|nr:glycine cleavage system protein GcvH [Candidatus Brocadia sapporoensis]MDG6006604.1 glycine cleavage system protein GcvH [Candidatus Brocadia sp.]OQD45901.1 glycine cleavage system protein H [Candidatus Brocadia sapporoensis]GJQ24539.1 MAG: glycine cleavage system H protein [Candidatus Brocadia sapporoensis]